MYIYIYMYMSIYIYATATRPIPNLVVRISNVRIVMWEYLTKRWTGEEAARLYRGAIIETLRKQRGVKRKYQVFEDNDKGTRR